MPTYQFTEDYIKTPHGEYGRILENDGVFVTVLLDTGEEVIYRLVRARRDITMKSQPHFTAFREGTLYLYHRLDEFSFATVDESNTVREMFGSLVDVSFWDHFAFVFQREET